jgi:hypothetical protein
MKSALDKRYDTIKVLVNSGHISSFRDIFNYIPKTIVYKDLHVNFNRFSRAIHNPALLTMKELMALADLFGIDAKLLIDMAYAQVLETQKRRSFKKIASITKVKLTKTI